MSKKNEKRSDREIADRIDKAFDSVPDIQTEAEINSFLTAAGYDPKALEKEGDTFVKEIMRKNWRFVSDETIDQEAAIFSQIPLRKERGKEWLIQTIRRNAPPKFQFANRNFEELSESDLASLLREIEAELILQGKELQVD